MTSFVIDRPNVDVLQEGMTALHLAAKFGHINVLMVLEDKVPWTNVSTKVLHLLVLHLHALANSDFV